MVEIISSARKAHAPTYKPNKVFATWSFNQKVLEDTGNPPTGSKRQNLGGHCEPSIVIQNVLQRDPKCPPTEKNDPPRTPSWTGSSGQPAEPPKETNKETLKERSPQPPKGVACGFPESGVPADVKEKQKASLKKQLTKKLGNIPKDQLVERAWQILNRPAPETWHPAAWHAERKNQLAHAIEALMAEALAGKPVSSILGIACHRAEQALGILAAGEAS